MRQSERDRLRQAKLNDKQARKSPALYKRNRDAILMRILESVTPKWGAIKVTVGRV